MDGCSLITWKTSGKDTGWGYLHIKGAVPGHFEEQTSNGVIQGEVYVLFLHPDRDSTT